MGVSAHLRVVCKEASHDAIMSNNALPHAAAQAERGMPEQACLGSALLIDTSFLQD